MTGSNPSRLKRSGLLVVLLAVAFAGPDGAAAGRVDFSVGSATVTGSDGRQRALAKGHELNAGDTVRTNQGRAQIRFTDGSYVSLQPETEFGIKEYIFEEQKSGSERGFFALAKGAMRTVTGLLGRSNRSAYQITTPTATIGIRGTGGVIQVLNDGSTLVTGTSGIWSLTNSSGSIDIPAGMSGIAPAKPDSPPQQTTQAPSTTPAPIQPPPAQFSSGENTTSGGTSASIPVAASGPVVALPSGSGYALASAFGSNLGQFSEARTDIVTATFNSTGQLIALAGDTASIPPITASIGDPSFEQTLQADGAHVEFGSPDGIIAWGRWIGTVLFNPAGVTETYGANQGLHYVIGMPTPVMPASGQAIYTLLGATSPTYQAGNTAPGTFTGTLNVTFGPSAMVGMNFNVAMPNGMGYQISGSTIALNSLFSGSFENNTPNPVTGTGAATCSNGCTASVAGFFAGADAVRAGIAYRLTDNATGSFNPILGAAAFKKQ